MIRPEEPYMNKYLENPKPPYSFHKKMEKERKTLTKPPLLFQTKL